MLRFALLPANRVPARRLPGPGSELPVFAVPVARGPAAASGHSLSRLRRITAGTPLT